MAATDPSVHKAKPSNTWLELRGCRSFYLLCSLVVLLLVYPFLPKTVLGSWSISLLNFAVLCTAVFSVSKQRRHIMVALGLGLPGQIVNFIQHFTETPALSLVQPVSIILFYGYVIYCLFRYVLEGREITLDKLFAAIAIYFLLGCLWAPAYGLTERLVPGSISLNIAGTFCFIGDDGKPILMWDDFLYFSFCTLTTVGYGDMTPVSAHARSLAMLEAVTGVLYVAITIARLVGLYRPELSVEITEVDVETDKSDGSAL